MLFMGKAVVITGGGPELDGRPQSGLAKKGLCCYCRQERVPGFPAGAGVRFRPTATNIGIRK